MSEKHWNTLRARAESLAGLGKAYADIARRHRVVADAAARGKRQVTAESEFSEWIFEACQLAAAAERALALEVELARSFGVTWDDIADALGISRQAAWGRFAKQPRWNKSRRLSQANQARRAAWIRHLRARIGDNGDQLLAFEQWRKQGRDPTSTQSAGRSNANEKSRTFSGSCSDQSSMTSSTRTHCRNSGTAVTGPTSVSHGLESSSR